MPEKRRRTILVVEDDCSIRAMLEELMQCEGHEPLVASDGREALELLRSLAALPDLILLDLMMPGMDGWTFRRHQLADERLRLIPVIVLTADANAEHTLDGLQLSHVMMKPFELEHLIAVMQRALETSC